MSTCVRKHLKAGATTSLIIASTRSLLPWYPNKRKIRPQAPFAYIGLSQPRQKQKYSRRLNLLSSRKLREGIQVIKYSTTNMGVLVHVHDKHISSTVPHSQDKIKDKKKKSRYLPA